MNGLKSVFVFFAWLVPPVWLGLLASVDFIAIPAGFGLADLPRTSVFQLNAEIFAHLIRVELVMATLFLLGAFLAGSGRPRKTIAIGLLVILMVEFFWLQPVLTEHVRAIVAGNPLPQTFHHHLYAGLDVVIMIALAGLSVSGARRILHTMD